MRKTLLALATTAMLAVPMVTQAQDTRPTLAVLAFDNGSIEPTWGPLSKGFQAMMLSQLATNTQIRVVERDRIQQIVDEQKLGSSGQLDAATIVRVGKILGARYMITGTYLSDTEKNVLFTVRAFDTETSQIIYTDGPLKGASKDMMTLIVQISAAANTKLRLPQLPAGAARDAASASTEKAKKIPFQALLLYSRAVDAEDKGQKSDALNLYKQAVTSFPEYDAAKTAVAKLSK